MDIKLKSNRVTRDVPDLSDYTKISIPWDSSGNDKLYVYMKPDEHSQKVYIGSDENKGKERSKSLTFSTIKSGVNTGTQSKATLNVIQEKAVYTYRLIISVQGGASNTIPASGGSIQLQTILETYIGDRLENSALVNSTYVNTSSGEGSYFTVSSKGLVTGVNRGTTVGNKRSIIVKATYTSGLINVTDSLAIYLEANSASYGNVSLTVTSPVNLDATGGTYTINPTASQTVSYTSGSTKNNTAANGGISLSYTQVSSSSGFSLSGNKVTYTNNNTTSSRSYQVNVIATGEGSKTNTKTITFTQSADSIISTTYSNDIVGFGGDGRFSGVSVALYNNQQINSQYVLPASAVTTSNPIKIMADNPAVVQKTVTYSSGYKEESLVPASEAYPGKIVYIKIGLVESSNGRVRTEIVTNSHTTNLFNDGIRITYNSYGTTNINQYKANVILGVSIVSATEAANRYNTNKTNFVNFNKYTLLLSGNKVESYDLSTNTVSYVGYKKTSSGSIFTDKTNYPDGLDYGGYFIYDVTVKGSEVYTSGSTVVKGKAVIPTLSSKLPSDNFASIQYPIDALGDPEILSQQGDVSNGNSVTRISIHVVRLNDKTSSEQVYLQFGVGGEYGSNNALAEFRVIKSRKAIVVGSIGRTEGSINLITPNGIGITSTSRNFTFTITDSSGQVDGTTLTGNTTWPSVQQIGLEFLLKNSNHKSNLINLLKDVLRSYGNYAVIRSSSSSLPQFNGTKWTLTQDEKSELWRILLVRSSAAASLYAIDYDR